MAAPLVIAARTRKLANAGPFPSTQDQIEFYRMVNEKQLAFASAWQAMIVEAWQPQGLMWNKGLTSNTWYESYARVLSAGLAPIRRVAVANAKRLSRKKRAGALEK